MFKKVITVLLLVALLSSITACGKKAETNADGSIAFSYILPGKFMNWMVDLAWYPEVLKAANAKVELINGGDGDQYYQNLDLKIGSGDLKDSAIAKISQVETYGSQGALLDLKPLIDQYGPNIKKYIEANPSYAALVTNADGKIYGLCQEYPTISNVTFYRADLFTKAGITKLPTNIAEFTDVLTQLKAANDDPNFYPFSGREGFLKYTEVFHANDNIDADGKVHGIYSVGGGYDVKSEGFKNLIQWYYDLNQAQLVDPEWVAGIASEDSWQTKMLSGKGAICDDFFTRPTWFMSNGGPTNDPDFDMQVMPAFNDADGNAVMRNSIAYQTDRFLVISAKSKNAVSIIKFMDYIFSDAGRELIDYGVEGKTSKTVDGKKEFISKFAEEVVKPLGTINYGVYQDRLNFPGPVDNEAFYASLDPLSKSFAADYFSKYVTTPPQIKYTGAQLKERGELIAKIQTEFDSSILKFINGSRPMSEWDSFVTDLDNLGYGKITEIDQAAYDAMK